MNRSMATFLWNSNYPQSAWLFHQLVDTTQLSSQHTLPLSGHGRKLWWSCNNLHETKDGNENCCIDKENHCRNFSKLFCQIIHSVLPRSFISFALFFFQLFNVMRISWTIICAFTILQRELDKRHLGHKRTDQLNKNKNAMKPRKQNEI